MQCCCVLTAPAPTALAYYDSLVVGDFVANAPVWHITAIELVAMALVRILQAVKRGVVGFQSYDS